MARPKKGAKGCEEANRKWKETMLRRYGSEEGIHRQMQEMGAKGGRNGKGPGYKGGFASDEVGEDGLTGKQRARIAGAVGGKRSRRGPAKDDIEKAEEVLEAEVKKDGRD